MESTGGWLSVMDGTGTTYDAELRRHDAVLRRVWVDSRAWIVTAVRR